MGGVNQRYSWVGKGVISDEKYFFVSKMSTESAHMEIVREVKSVADNEFGLENRKWEELTKDIPG